MKRVLFVFLLVASTAFAQDGPPEGRRSRRPRGETSTFESPLQAHTKAEKKILAVLTDLDENHRRGNMNVPERDGRLLRMLAETSNAKHIVEIGTSNGYSGLWFLLALQTTGGHLITYEIDRNRADQALANFKKAGVEKDVTLVFGDAHEEILELGPELIDIIFLDADKEGYIDYLDKLLPKLRPGGLIIAHNMNSRQAHPPFVEAITTNPELETLFLHMDLTGIAVTMKKR